MKIKRKLSLILCLIFTLFLTINYGEIESKAETTAKPELTIASDDNYVHLNWNKPDEDKYYTYRIFSKESGAAVFQSIPSKGNVKVLNIYPGVGDNLKGWMENPNAECDKGYGKGLISVDKVDLKEFDKLPSSYMKNSDGTWKYDVIMLGSWDSNNGLAPSNESVDLFGKFIDDGRGFLAGHDTIGCDYGTNLGLGRIRDKFNIKVGYWSNDKIATDDGYHLAGGFAGDKISVKKSGLLTNYPWNIGSVGTKLKVPTSHSTSNFAYGDVWMNYVENSEKFEPGPKNDIICARSTMPESMYENCNYYLTTWNNTAMIQTGHSNGKATPDEQKVLANTLFYLAQVSEDTKWDDHKGQDVKAPSKPNIKTVTRDSSDNKIKISFDKSEDMGSTYSYYVEAKEKATGNTVNSDTKTTTVTSGLKGYSVVVDNEENTVPSNKITTTSTDYSVDNTFGNDFYVHVAAVDNAGNISDVSTYKYSRPVLELTPSTTAEVKDKVTIKAETSSSKEIAKIITPDGKEVKGSTVNYDVYNNETYTFKAVDVDGNEVTASIKINNIKPDVILNVEPDKSKVRLDENITVDLSVDNITNIGAIDAVVKYDSSKLKFLGVTQVPGIIYYAYQLKEGEYRMTFATSPAALINSKKSLLKLNFKSIGAGDAKVDVTKGRISSGSTNILRDAECGETYINIYNSKMKAMTLDDIFNISQHVGEDPAKLLPTIDADINLDGKIDKDDIDLAYKLMLQNKNEKM